MHRAEEDIQRAHWGKDKAGRRPPGHPVVTATFAPMAEIVASVVPNPAAASVLDVGCGNGFLQWELERRFLHVVGLDYSDRMLTVNPCRHRCRGSSTALPFPDRSFDVAVASHLLHHLGEEDRLRTIRELARVARRGVVSFEPNRNNPLTLAFALVKREERMAAEFTRRYLAGLFARAGLPSAEAHVRGWIVPNAAPVWWIPVGQLLERSPCAGLGFDLCAVSRLHA